MPLISGAGEGSSGELAQPGCRQSDRLFGLRRVYWEQTKGGVRLVVYLDIVMLLNFLVDFLLLLGTNRLSGFPLGPGRSAAGALLGGVYSGACMLPGFRFLGNGLWRTVSLACIAALAFGLGRSAWKRGGVFVLLSMAMGGVALSLGKGSILSLALSALSIWLLCGVSFGGTVGGQEFVPVEIPGREGPVRLTALKDTGNTLRDPITGEPVLVIDHVTAALLTGLTESQLASPIETLALGTVPGLRLIPYRAVGCSSGMLLGMRFEKVKIGTRVQSAVIAFAPGGLGGGSMYQALIGGVL